MQNRTEFLATGLVPVMNTSELSTDGCSICTDSFTDPVALPCKHIFCKQCVVDWLSLPYRNTCPHCRYQCFRKTFSGIPTPARVALMAQALTHSGLTDGDFSTFNDDISWDTSSLARATASAHFWMIEQNYPRVDGPSYTFINRQHLGHDIIATGNLLRGYAQASGRPYTRTELRNWRIIVDGLYDYLGANNGRAEHALQLSWSLKAAAVRALHEAGIRDASHMDYALPTADIQEAESPAGDLDLLVGYLALKAEEAAARRRQRAEAIEREPRLIARMGMRLQNAFRH